MKACVASMKELSSEYSLAATKAKLTGSATAELQAKAQGLTAQIKQQAEIVRLGSERHDTLTKALESNKAKQASLQEQIKQTKAALEESTKTTGKNSEETKALQDKLTALQKEEKGTADTIQKNETALSTNTVSVNKNTEKLEKMKAELKETEKAIPTAKMEEWSDKLDKVSGKLDTLQKGANIVSGAAAAVGVAAAKSSMDFEDAFAKTKTIMDDTEVSYDDMKAAILDLSDATGTSAAQIADDVYNAISAGQSTGDAVAFLKTNTDLARAGFAETGQSLDLLTTIMNAYGDASFDANTISDMMIQTQNKGKTTVSELASSMGKVIPIASSTNTQLDQLAAAYAMMTARGVATAESTTYLKSMLNDLSKSGSTADEILREKTGKSFSELMASGSSLADVLAVLDGAAQADGKSLKDMFSSTEAGSAALSLFTGSADEFNSMLGTMQNSTGTTAEALGKLDTDSYKMQVTLNQVKNAGIQLGEAIMTRAQPYLQKFGETVEKATNWFSGLSDEQMDMIVTIGSMVVALAPAVAGLNMVVKGAKNTIDTVSTLRKGIGVLHDGLSTFASGGVKAVSTGLSFLAANPIVAVVAGVGVLVGAFAFAYTHFEGFRNAVNSIGESIKGGFAAALEFGKNVANGIGNAISSAGEWITNSCEKVAQDFDTMKTNVENKASELKENATQAFETMKTNAVNKVTELKTNATNKINELKTNAANAWQSLKNDTASKVTTMKDNTVNSFNTMKTNVSNKLTELKNGAATSWSNLLTDARTKASNIKTTWSEGFTNVKNTATNLMENARGNVASKLSAIQSAYMNAGGGIKGITSGALTAVRGYFQTYMDAANTITGGRFGSIASTVQNKMNEAKNNAWNTLTGIANAFQQKMDGAKNFVSNAINTIKGFFNFSWSLPHLAMPHPYISGSFSLKPPSVPSFGINWYANGGIMTQPTAFGTTGNTVLVGGEAGAEAILPLQPFYTQLASILDDKLSEYFGGMAVQVTVNNWLDGDPIASKTAPKVEAYLAKTTRKTR